MDSEKSKPVDRRTFIEPSPRWLRFFGQVKRARQYVDQNVQGGLITKMAVHWGLFFFTTAFAFVVIQAITSPNGRSFLQRIQEAMTEFSVLGLLMLTLLPAFMLDVIRFSNRFAGPMVRLRRFLRELGEHGETPVLKFRDDDFWGEVAREYNLCRERIVRQRLEITRLQRELAEHSLHTSHSWKAEEQTASSNS